MSKILGMSSFAYVLFEEVIALYSWNKVILGLESSDDEDTGAISIISQEYLYKTC